MDVRTIAVAGKAEVFRGLVADREDELRKDFPDVTCKRTPDTALFKYVSILTGPCEERYLLVRRANGLRGHIGPIELVVSGSFGRDHPNELARIVESVKICNLTCPK